MEAKPELINSLAADLVRLKVDLIVTAGPTPTRAAKAVTATIPIVMMQDPDPVGNGFVASLAHPGGNITGLATYAPEISGKQLEILKETVPKLSRVAVLGTSTSPGYSLSAKELELAAEALKVKLQHLDVPINPNEIESAFRTAGKVRADALLVLGGAVLSSQRVRVTKLAAKNWLPAMYYNREFVEAGGLMSYASNLRDLDRRAATHVDKIRKGCTPADLPVEQPMKFAFVVNLQAAKAIALTIPPNVLVRADKVIH